MKNLIAVIIMVPFLQGCGQKLSNNKFQIVAGDYNEVINNLVENSSASTLQHGIFKIDTATGKTWIYLDSIDLATNEGIVTEGWREVKDVSTKKAITSGKSSN